jgi:hypothetical protein
MELLNKWFDSHTPESESDENTLGIEFCRWMAKRLKGFIPTEDEFRFMIEDGGAVFEEMSAGITTQAVVAEMDR